MLCRGGAYGATMNATWQDSSLTGVFIRLLWSELQKAPGTADSSFDFTVLDREMNQAVKNGKVFSLSIKAGDDGTPLWLFTNGVTALSLQDSGSDGEAAACGSKMTLGNPTEIAYPRTSSPRRESLLARESIAETLRCGLHLQHTSVRAKRLHAVGTLWVLSGADRAARGGVAEQDDELCAHSGWIPARQ